MLFIHAITGCGVSKYTTFGKILKENSFPRSCVKDFIPKQTTEVPDKLGCQVMVVLFGDEHTDSLSAMRYNVFSKKVVSASSFVTPERLPPTESATRLHCRRSYYQIMVWMEKAEGMDVMDWGWSLQDNQYVSIMSRLNASPDTLLKVIHCSCFTACKTLICS